MSVYDEINNALTQSLIDLSIGLPIALENDGFDPLGFAGLQYLDITFIYNDQTSLSKKLYDEVTGIYQISVYTKSGIGTKESTDVINTLTGFYKHNVKLPNGNQTVVIVNSGRNEGRNINGWYVVDVSVSFKSEIIR